MGKTTKVWLVIAASLVLIGILFIGVMRHLEWDFSKLSTSEYETNHYEISQSVHNISIETDTADVTFAISNNGKCRVECYEEIKAKHSVSVENSTLNIKLINKKAWYDYIGIHFSSPKIKIYLPKTQYSALSLRGSTGKVELPNSFQFASVEILLSTGNVNVSASATGSMKIKTSTGNIRVQNVSADNLDLRVSTGKTFLDNVTCNRLVSEGDTGDITLNNVVVTEKMKIERSTGDVKFTNSDAAEIYVETDTGDITGSLLSDKVFIVETDTGRVNVPKSTTGGRCEIETDTGDIEITVK